MTRGADLRRWLRGRDRADAAPLPIGEALHPVVLLAAVVLVINDWWLKPSPAPGWLTGKLSDVAGLVLAPLVLSALVGALLHLVARAGARIDPSLSPVRLWACVGVTGGVFAACKLAPPVAALVGDAWRWVSPGARIVADPTDLLALPALLLAVHLGRDELRRVPLGRMAAIRRLGRRPGPALADVRAAGADPGLVTALVAASERGDVTAVDDGVRRLS